MYFWLITVQNNKEVTLEDIAKIATVPHFMSGWGVPLYESTGSTFVMKFAFK